MKDWTLGRVQIFGLAVAEDAAAEGDDSGTQIVNWKEQATSEPGNQIL